MKICLVLFSGLPGAGKTTLALAVQQLLLQRSDEKNGVNAEPLAVVEALLELDAFMCDGSDDDVQKKDTIFTPEAWRRACDAVREATLERLRQCLLGAQEGVATRFVFLVDTLPYRSMRAAYWKMCRDLSKSWQQTRCEERAKEKKNKCDSPLHDDLVFVGMMEVRVNTPIEVCIERNEHRIGTPQYIPPDVIQRMHDAFDVDVGRSAASLTEENCWVLLPRQGAIHWPVVWLKKWDTESGWTPTFLAQKLLEKLLSQDVVRELEKQREAFVESEMGRQERERRVRNQHDVGTPANNGWLHQVDLRMRAAVRNHVEGLKKTGVLWPGLGRVASKRREEHYARAKELLARQEHDGLHDSDKEALVQDLLFDFERGLFDLKCEP